MESNQFFATARPWRLYLTVALPGLISMLAAALYSAFEGAFVGKVLGEAAFAAVNIAMPIVMINFALADMIGVGSSVHISVSLGQKNEKRASNFFTCALIMIFLTGLLTGAFLYFTAPMFTRLMGAEGELAELAVQYVRVYAVMSPITTLVFATDNYLRISGFVKGSMFLNIGMTCLTVLFLWLFLVVVGTDVTGAALSACLSMFICAIIALIPFVLKKSVLRFVKPHFSRMLVSSTVKCGMPIFLNNIAGRVTSILMNSALLRIGNSSQIGGQTAVAAYAVLMYSAGMVEPMLYGLCDSVSPAVGYNWGAKSLSRVRDITKCSLTVCGIVALICSGLLVFFPQLFTAIFVDPSNTALVELAIHALPLFGVSFIVGWFCFAIQGFLASIEKPLPATLISVSKAMVFPVIFIFALEFMGLDGLWLNYTAASLCTAILALILVVMVQKTMNRDILRGGCE